jgi:hypothetical protein
VATIVVPAPEVAVGRRILAFAAQLLLLGLLAATIGGGGSWLISGLTQPVDAAPRPQPESTIRPGVAPAVAATARGRIVSLDCALTGPIEVAADRSGAYVVTSGADQVDCPTGHFREGFTLRWPIGSQPETVPL